MSRPAPWTAPGNDYRGIADLPALDRPSIDVIVPVYERTGLLDRTLAGLRAQTLSPTELRVIVADDGSAEDVGAVVSRHTDHIPIDVVRQEDRGFGLATVRNLGASAGTGAVIVFLDGDGIPDRSFLEHHAFWHARAGNVVVAGSRVSVDSSSWSPSAIASGDLDLRSAAGVEPDDTDVVPDDWRRVFYRRTRTLLLGDEAFRSGVGANLSVRRERFEVTGGFSGDFAAWGGEDTEEAWRLWNDGAFLVPDNRAVVYHQIQEDPADAAERRSRARRLALPLVADRVPHRFYRRSPTPLATVPKVSWLVHVTDAQHAARALTFCSKASLSDAEVILMGPGDALEEQTAMASANQRVSVIDHDLDGAFERALRTARGEYVAFLDHRSRVHPGMLEKAVDRLERDPRASVARCSYRIGDGDRYLRLDDLAAIDRELGAAGLPFFAVARRRELMKDWGVLDDPGAAWSATLDRAERIELIATNPITVTEDRSERRARLLRFTDAKAVGVAELARIAARRARRGGRPDGATDPGEPDGRVPIEYVGLTGKSNLGDDAVLAAIEGLMPWARIGRDLEGPRALMVGGGTLINGRRYYLTRMLRQDSPYLDRVLFGTGVRNPTHWGVTEPMEDWFSFIDSSIYAALRGPDSVANLRDLGYGHDLPVLGDPALWLQPPPDAERRDGLVVVCPVFTDGNLLGGDDRAVFERLTATSRRLLDEGRPVTILSAFPEDDRWIIGLLDALDGRADYVAGYADLDETMRLLASSDLVIGERLHASILAAACSTPFVALEYRPKVRDFTRSIDQETLTLPTDALGGLDHLVDDVLTRRSALEAEISASVEAIRVRLADAAEHVRRSLEHDR